MSVQHSASFVQCDHEHIEVWQADQKLPIHPMTSPKIPKQQNLMSHLEINKWNWEQEKQAIYRIIRAKWRVSLAKFSSTAVCKPHIKPFICQKKCQRTFWRKQQPCHRILQAISKVINLSLYIKICRSYINIKRHQNHNYQPLEARVVEEPVAHWLNSSALMESSACWEWTRHL